jgi:hypothetical protein
MNDDGYPKYYRPNNGCSYDVGGYMVDNSWIVPYNLYLSAKYDCHINIKCAVSLGGFKYVFKYIHKGRDLAGIEVNRRDKIKWWIEGQYISASEAAWCIFHFDMQVCCFESSIVYHLLNTI